MRPLAVPARLQVKPAPATAIDGWVLFAAGIAVGLSAFESLRVEVGGLYVHPYLVVLGAAFVPIVGPRLARFPASLVVASLAFLFLVFLATVASDRRFGELVKTASGLTTVVFVAVLVRTKAAFRLGALGLAISTGALALYGLFSGNLEAGGVNPLEEVANKNAFSLYSLPALLLASHLLITPGTGRVDRIALGAAVLSMVAATFASANRSGWMGVILIGLLLLIRAQRFRTAAALVVIGTAAWFVVERLGFMHVFEARVDQTLAGYKSDDLRIDLVKGAFATALDSPLLGVGMEQLQIALAKWTKTTMPRIDPHNLFGHVAGSFGLPALAILLGIGARLFVGMDGWGRTGLGLTRMLLVLFFVRAQFSREALYAPGFSIAFGLVIGHALAEGSAVAAVSSRSTVPPPRTPPE